MKTATFHRNNYSEAIIVFTLFFVSLFIHSLNLWTEPFWYDEMVSVKATLFDFGHIKHISEWDNNPPFYYYCLWLWSKITGISEYSIRFFNVIIHSFSVVTIYLLVRKRSTLAPALFSAVFLILHNFGIEYSHEARAYSLTILLTLISTSLFFNFLENKNTTTAILLGLVNFLIIYTHYIAGLTLLFQAIFLIVYKKDHIKLYSINWLILLLFIALRFTKKQFLILLSFNQEGKTFWLQKSDSSLLKETIMELFSGPNIWMILLVLTISSVTLFLIKFKSLTNEAKPLAIYSFIISIGGVITLFLLGKITPVFLGRYLLFTIPFIGIILSNYWLRSNLLIQYLISSIVIFLMVFNLNLNPHKKMDYRLAVYVSQKLQKNNSPILIQTKDCTSLFAYFYNRELFVNYHKTSELLSQNYVYEMEDYNDYQKLNIGTPPRVVLCQVYAKPEDTRKIAVSLTEKGYKNHSTIQVKGVKISLFSL